MSCSMQWPSDQPSQGSSTLQQRAPHTVSHPLDWNGQDTMHDHQKNRERERERERESEREREEREREKGRERERERKRECTSVILIKSSKKRPSALLCFLSLRSD